MFLKRYILKFLHFFKKKDEHVTVLIFKDSGLGEVKARNVHHSTLKAFVIGGLSFLLFAIISFVAASLLFKERMTALKYLAENQMLKLKISEYNKKLSEIEAKINYLQEYEQKIRGLSKELKISPKYLPQGGKETSLDSLSIEKNYLIKMLNNVLEMPMLLKNNWKKKRNRWLI